MKATLSLAVIAALTALASAAWAVDLPGNTAPVAQLPGATVGGQSTVFDRSTRHLHRLQNSLPELGGEAAHHHRLSQRLHDYLARHRDPNQATGQQRAMMDRAQTPPGP